MSVVGIPYSDFVERSSGKHIRISIRESYIIDSFVVAGVTKFRTEGGSVNPINIGLIGSTEEVGEVVSEGD